MDETPGLIGHETAAVAQAEPDIGKPLEHAAEHKRNARHGGLERKPDEIAHVVGLESFSRQDLAMRVHQDEGLERVRHRPHRLKRRIVEVAAVHVGPDLRAAQAERGHGSLELLGRLGRRLQRQRGEAHEPVGTAFRHRGDLVVLQRRAGGAQRRLHVVEEGLYGGAHELHRDAVAIHVGEAQVEIEDLARHRPLHHLAVDQHDDRAVLLGQLGRDARRFLAEQADRLLRQHVGVHVDGDARGHCIPDDLEVRLRERPYNA
jgi:hypothetical protein